MTKSTSDTPETIAKWRATWTPEKSAAAAERNRNRVWTEEMRTKHGLKRRGQKQPPEAVAKSVAAHLGKPLSEEHKTKISASLKGRTRKPHTPETKAKIGAKSRGRKMPQVAESNRRRAKVKVSS